MVKLAPSILAADFADLGKNIKEVEETGVEFLHIDVMDGSFVPSISFGIPVIKSIRSTSNLVFDVHLMVEEPIRYVDEFAAAGADIITVHAEACKHLHRTVTRIKELGKKVGVALNPTTPLTVLDYIIEELDMVLIMSVNPGFGGQSYISSSTKKISDLKKIINQKKPGIDIQVDGGINTSNAAEIIQAGATVLVAGTSIFSGDVADNITMFREVFEYAANRDEAGKIT